MAILMRRDLYILKALRRGPLSVVQLHARLLAISKKKFGNEFISQVDVDTPASRDVAATIMEEDQLFTISALQSRLTRLLKDAFIKSRTYAHSDGRGRTALYVVGKSGIRELYPYDIERSDIHRRFPRKLKSAHKTLTTAITKRIKQEAFHLKYKVKIVDEKHLRKIYKKGVATPNLLVSITFTLDSEKVERTICLIIDNGSTPASSIYNKCIKIGWSTVLLCPARSRIDKLKTFFKKMSNDTHSEQILNKIFFAVLGDFIVQGFAASEMISIDGRHLQGITSEVHI